MPDYKNGKIYKLTNSDESLVYIGSTTQPLCERKAGHRATYKRWIKAKSGVNYVTSFKLFEANEDDVNIQLIEAYPCNSKEELHARERFYIKQMECINKVVPGRTKKEYREDNKIELCAKEKEYREENKAVILARHKEYHAKNRTSILAKKKEYRHDNKNAIKEYREKNRASILAKKKEYYEKNKDILKARGKAYRARKRAERECKLYTDIFDGLQAMKTAREARFNSM
jgi:hypothetical protein